jgi:hypothetical protein
MRQTEPAVRKHAKEIFAIQQFSASSAVFIGSLMLFGFDPDDLELIGMPKARFSTLIPESPNYGL